MPQTVIRGSQILNNTVQRQDIDTTTVGQALVTKLLQGTNVTLSSTGADSGTGDVTVSVTAGAQGPPGPAGLNAFNITSGSFTIPAVGSTVSVTLNDASWVVVGQMVYVDGAGGGAGLAGALQVTAKTGNQITLLNPTPAPALPLASSAQVGLLNQLSGTPTDFVGGDNACHVMPIASATKSGDLNQLSGNTTDFVDGTNVCRNLVSSVPVATATVGGLVPTPPNNTTTFLRGDATFSQPSLNSLTSTAWTPWTAVMTPSAGAITAQNGASYYLRMGKTMFVNMFVQVTNIGTASGSQTIGGLPAPLAHSLSVYVRENAVNGLGYTWILSAGGSSGPLLTSSGNAGPAWANNIQYTGFIVYETT